MEILKRSADLFPKAIGSPPFKRRAEAEVGVLKRFL